VLAALLRTTGADDADALGKTIDAARKTSEAAPQQTGVASSTPGAADKSPAPNTTPGAADKSTAPSAADGAGSGKPPAFTDVAQLGRIAGVTPDIIAAIAPLITVFGGEKINAATASEDVIAALPNVGGAQIDAFLAARSRGPLSEGQAGSLLGAAREFVSLEKKRTAASVDIEIRLPDGYSEAASATIIVLPHDSAPYRVLRWSPFLTRRASAALADREP
jgi:general secretion pathway protein K